MVSIRFVAAVFLLVFIGLTNNSSCNALKVISSIREASAKQLQNLRSFPQTLFQRSFSNQPKSISMPILKQVKLPTFLSQSLDNLSKLNVDPVYTIVAVNWAVYAAIQINPNLVNKISKSDQRLKQGEYYRLITAIFAHQSIIHIISNTMSLLSVGHAAAEIYGNSFVVLCFLVSGLSGFIFSWMSSLSPNSIGASGGIFGLLASVLFYYAQNNLLSRNRKN